jgi:hypothetical protein
LHAAETNYGAALRTANKAAADAFEEAFSEEMAAAQAAQEEAIRAAETAAESAIKRAKSIRSAGTNRAEAISKAGLTRAEALRDAQAAYDGAVGDVGQTRADDMHRARTEYDEALREATAKYETVLVRTAGEGAEALVAPIDEETDVSSPDVSTEQGEEAHQEPAGDSGEGSTTEPFDQEADPGKEEDAEWHPKPSRVFGRTTGKHTRRPGPPPGPPST